LGDYTRRTLAAFDEIFQSEFQPQDVVVTGYGLNGQNVATNIGEVLDLPVNILNLADRLNIPIDSEDGNPWDPLRMDSALALAVMEIEGFRGLNFHKGQFAAKKFLAKHKDDLIKTGILAAAVLVLFLFTIITESYTLNRQIDRLDRQITGIFQSTFPQVKKIVDPFKQMHVKVKEAQKNAVLQVETKPHTRSVDILNAISKSIPETIVVDIARMVISTDSVLISGTTDTFNSVDDIKGKLEQIESFKKVTISSANTDRSGKEVRFQIKVEF
jgi:Tfp pilus assembly protein PilN